MVPVIDSTKTMGIVFLPGAMTGMILAGADPLQAVRLQVVVNVHAARRRGADRYDSELPGARTALHAAAAAAAAGGCRGPVSRCERRGSERPCRSLPLQ